ncbi:MAG: hypothetical protein E7344_03895 [Clostridiales bacterium]|nr:hypothetical protein [Clostridiales bacterium]
MVKQQTKIKVGASFFALAFFMLITKNGIYFLYYVVAVVLHEFAHAKMAKKLGYKTKDVRLSAFGAVLYGDFGDMSFVDEAKIALAGPLLNLFMAVCTLALWWAFPALYAFTQPFYIANVCIFAINLLPCYPLDGGRVLFAVMGQKFGENKAKKLFVTLGVATSFLSFCLFLCLLFYGVVNLTFGLFGLFLFANATAFKSQKVYQRLVGLQLTKQKLQRGAEIKTVALHCDNNVSCLAKYCCSNCLYNVQVVGDDNKVVSMFAFDEIEDILINYPPNTKLKQID